MNKKVLIITYYWPPSGGPGVQRVLKFCKYLPKFGWEPIVLTVENGEYPAIDEKLVNEIPAGLKVYKTKTIEFFSLFKKLQGKKRKEGIDTFVLDSKKNSFSKNIFLWIRSNFFVPDARIGWKRFAVTKAKEVIKKEGIDVVFTSSPPHSLQLIGLALKEKTKLPWVADFRDPWTTAFWEKNISKTSIARKYNRKLERQVMEHADYLTAAWDQVINEITNNSFDKGYSIIYNGFDAADFKNVKRSNSQKYRIKYTGSIANSQIPHNFLEAISELSLELKAKLDVQFFGKFDAGLRSLIENLDLEDLVQLKDYIDHDEVINEICNADLLIVLVPHTSKGIIPGKFFEYLGTGNQILALGPAGADIQKLVDKIDCGNFYTFEDDLKSFLQDRLAAKNIDVAANPISSKISSYSREAQAEQLSEILDKHVR